MYLCISFLQLPSKVSASTASALQPKQRYYQFALDTRKRFSCTYICSQKEEKMVCEVPISMEKKKHLLGALGGSLGSPRQHHRPQLSPLLLAALNVQLQKRRGQLDSLQGFYSY